MARVTEICEDALFESAKKFQILSLKVQAEALQAISSESQDVVSLGLFMLSLYLPVPGLLTVRVHCSATFDWSILQLWTYLAAIGWFSEPGFINSMLKVANIPPPVSLC